MTDETRSHDSVAAEAAASPRDALNARLERKVNHSKWALFLERLWPRLWLIAAVVGVFVLASLLGLWPILGDTVHIGLLGLTGLAFIAAIGWAIRTPWPTRDEAIRRLDLGSTIAHRPATSYEDTLTAGGDSPATRAIWQAHRQRLAKALEKLRVAPPRPDTPRHDPWALRSLLLLAVITLTALVGNNFSDRIAGAFRFQSGSSALQARVDAWVTPPAYTARPPIMLADGGNAANGSLNNHAGLSEVPDRSQLIVRASGVDPEAVNLEVQPEGEQPVLIQAGDAEAPGRTATQVAELRYELRQSARVRLLVDGRETAAWTFSVIADRVPEIALVEEPAVTQRGSMKLNYRVADDYGVATAQAKVVRAPQAEDDPGTAWARPEALTGPRLPLQRPPELNLRLPRTNAKDGEAITHLELGSHPWAGLRVMMTLEATDVAGQVGTSEAIELVLPQRVFKNPLARAIVEQRRKLVEDSRNRKAVERALAALTIEPEGFIDDVQVYLGLRSAYYRLQRDATRPGLDSVIDQLWDVALRVEDGDLSDAERRLRDAQEKLSQALQDGSSDEEIQQATEELRQALNEYVQQLQKEAQNSPLQPQGSDEQNQMLSQQDLERMMQQIEEMAKAGSREQAQQMLSELRDILERLQAGQSSQAQSEASKQMMEMMSELGDIVGQQQRLLDDTFGEQRRSGERGEQGQGQQGEQGQRGGQPRRGPQGEQGQMGQGTPGQGQQQGQRGNDGQLGDRQSALRNRLSQLQSEMQERGMGTAPGQFDGAREAMEAAEQALQDGDLPGATQEQSRALDQMRQGAQEMARQMMQNMPQRYGRNGDAPRDPLGRPQRSQGPDQGTSVKVPDQIDIQRARQILEELRRRLGDAQRSPTELDYIERLLERF